MTGERIAAIIGILAALVLALKGTRWRHLPPRRRWMMAAVWIAIIVAAVLVIRLLGLAAR